MYVEISLTLDVGEQDTTSDAIESAKNAMRCMDFDELIDDVMIFETNIHPECMRKRGE